MVKYNHNHGKHMISFRSQVTIKILNYFFLNPGAKHYINELARILDLDPKNIDRKLKELEKNGLLQSEFLGKQRYFYLNRKNFLLKNYRQIFLKTYGLEQKLKDLSLQTKGVKTAYLFGSYVKNKMDISSDIDLLLVGNHSTIDWQRKINQLQKEIGREINTLNLSEQEFKNKQKANNPFIENILTGKNIKLI